MAISCELIATDDKKFDVSFFSVKDITVLCAPLLTLSIYCALLNQVNFQFCLKYPLQDFFVCILLF